MRGFDIVIKIGGNAVAAQINATLNRTAQTADITDKIAMDWTDNLANLKSWTIAANGAYIMGDAGMEALETAFTDSTEVEVEMSSDDISLTGTAVITSFPIGAMYNMDATYNIVLVGKGELTRA